MNTQFNILWFEDTDEWYEAMKEEVEEYIKSLCFIPNFIRYKSLNNNELEEIVQETPFDLVFADLNLRESTQGNEAIKLLRENSVLADALFYSTDGIEKIKNVMTSEVLEGVYLSYRDEYLFPDKAKLLVDKVVKRSEDILNIRGMLMDNVSEFDEKLKDLIRKYLSIIPPEKALVLNKYAYDKVASQMSINAKKASSMEGDAFILTALNESFILDSYKLSMIVNKIFDLDYSTYDEMKQFHVNYSETILRERNKLAHAKKEPEANGVFYFENMNGNRTEYTPEKCREIRSNINDYIILLNEAFDVI